MIRTVFFLFVFISSSRLFGQLPHEQDAAWIRDHYIRIERSMAMRDGVKLLTAICMPKDLLKKRPGLYQQNAIFLCTLRNPRQFLIIYTARDSDFRKVPSVSILINSIHPRSCCP